MSRKAIREYFKARYARCRKASKKIKQIILDEFWSNTGYNRKYAIRKLNGMKFMVFSLWTKSRGFEVYG